MQLTNIKQRLITSVLTVVVFLAAYPMMLVIAGYFFDLAALQMSELSALVLGLATVIITARDQLVEKEPDRAKRVKTVIEISAIGTLGTIVALA